MAGVALNFGLKNEQNFDILVNFFNVEVLNISCVDVGGEKEQ
jgi:hypothetical protein